MVCQWVNTSEQVYKKPLVAWPGQLTQTGQHRTSHSVFNWRRLAGRYQSLPRERLDTNQQVVSNCSEYQSSFSGFDTLSLLFITTTIIIIIITIIILYYYICSSSISIRFYLISINKLFLSQTMSFTCFQVFSPSHHEAVSEWSLVASCYGLTPVVSSIQDQK